MNCGKYSMVTIFNDYGSNIESELDTIYKEKSIPIYVIYWPVYSLKYIYCVYNDDYPLFVPGTQNKGLIFCVFLLIVSRYFSVCFCYFVKVLCSEVKYEGWFICNRHTEREVSSGTWERKYTFHKWTVNFFPISAPMYSGTLEQLWWEWWMFQIGCRWTPAILKGHRVKKMKNLCFCRDKVTLA